ncbi:MAG: RagB/SusD family nutrient uptake outer membrane protein [Clostridium sp.]|nr:RagB/SusD family nutrient uptake outer membrane protein [Clostridium sp.]
MKTKYILPLAICCLGVATQSCGDFLDTDPAAIYSEDLVWGSASNVEAFVMGRYNTAFGYLNDPALSDRTLSNNMVNCRAACPGEARGLMENTYNVGLNNRFGFIRACNMIIERCGESTVLAESDKTQYVALGKFMRAMCYYDFARKTGKFIWVDKVLSADDKDFNLPLTKSLEESYKLVLTDMREAVPNLPLNVKAGAIGRNYGYALLSEVLLTAAAYTNDAASLQVGGKSLYQEAIDAVDAIQGASLDPNFGDIFNENGAYSSSEILAARYYDKDYTTVSGTNMINLIANVVNTNLELQNCSPLWNSADIFEAWLDYSPSQNLVDAFLVIDEQDGTAKKWNETSQFVNNTKVIDQATAFTLIEHKDDDQVQTAYQVTTAGKSISDLMYEGRDARFDESILRDNSVFYGEKIAMFNRGNMTRWSGANYGANHIPLTNYCTRKTIYTNISPRPFYNVSTAWHQVYYRYGRALLNKAEAQLRLNKVSDAVATFNQTRTTHGQLPASTASSLAEAWNDYKIERRVELFWESDFYWSLLRWGKYGYEANDGVAPSGNIQELCNPATFIEINRDRDAAFVGIVQFQNNARTFNPNRAYLFPIPQSLINANSAVTAADQNPGWE